MGPEQQGCRGTQSSPETPTAPDPSTRAACWAQQIKRGLSLDMIRGESPGRLWRGSGGALLGWGDLPCSSCHPNFPVGLVGHSDTDSLPRAPSQGGVCLTHSPKTCLDLEGPLQKESPRPCLPGTHPAACTRQGGGTWQGQLRTGQDIRSERLPAPRAAIDVPFGCPAHPLLTARP